MAKRKISTKQYIKSMEKIFKTDIDIYLPKLSKAEKKIVLGLMFTAINDYEEIWS